MGGAPLLASAPAGTTAPGVPRAALRWARARRAVAGKTRLRSRGCVRCAGAGKSRRGSGAGAAHGV